MAFTDEQEGILKEIIDAYENGKRISDLPELTNGDPFDLYTEVVYEGESRKGRLADMLPYVEGDVAYGISRNINDSSPTCTRIGNMDLHRTLPVQSLMRGCLLDDDGNVVEYLPDSDWTGATLDGSKGQVMVELPAHYRKCALYDDGTMEVWLSLYPVAGYQSIPKMYVGAYEATVQRSTNKLSSVMSDDADYRGGPNNAEWDGTYRTFIRRPASSLPCTTSHTYARNRGTAGLNGCGWNALIYEALRTIAWLFVVEYATLNSQLSYNAELTSEGYHQGGLGNGVTTLNSTSWSDFNGQRPFLPIGLTNSLGNSTGVVEYTMPEEYGTLTLEVNRYRGIEVPYGHLYKSLMGILIMSHGSEESGGEGDGLNYIYVCTDPAKFSNTAVDDYTFIGTAEGSATGSAWLRFTKVVFGTDGDIVGTDSGGSTSTYYCDGHNVNNDVTEDTLRGVRFGGYANSGATAGFFCLNSTNTPSTSATTYGSRLCFIPA